MNFRPLSAFALILMPALLNAQKPDASELLNKAVTAMGGESLLNSIQKISYTGRGHEAMIEQSARQEPPYLSSYFTIRVEKNLPAAKCLYALAYFSNTRPYQLVVDGKKTGAMVGKNFFPMYPEVDEQLDLSPEKILFTALSGQPGYEKDTLIHGVKNHAVAFKWNGNPVRLFLNTHTALPTGVEVTRFYTSNFNYVWGDTKRFTYFSFWHLENNGLHYPHQFDVLVNRIPFRSLTIDSVKFNVASLGVDTLSIPDSAYQKMQALQKMIDPLQKPTFKTTQIAADIYQISGNWNVEFIKTEEGIVVLESPVSAAYSAEVFEVIRKQYPSDKISAVITTSNAWPHFGGLRSYIARKIPAYALELNKSLVVDLINATHSFYPDELSEKKVTPQITWVNKRTLVGKGTNRMELIPMMTESGDRMMVVYFPEKKLLYSSDMVQPSFKGGFFMKQYLSEIGDVIKREKLEVENLFGMHLPLTSYNKVLEYLNAR